MNLIFRISLVFSALLLAINFYGEIFGSYVLPTQANWDMGDHDRLIEELTVSDLDHRTNESDQDYFYRITKQINEYMIHGEPNKTAIWDNYFLWLHDTVRADTPLFVENYNVARGLRKGIGQCSQHSNILFSALKNNGYDARILRLSGHVVAAVTDNEQNWYMLDADYGVVIPASLEQIEENPQSVMDYYAHSYSIISPDMRLPMIDLYGTADDNRLFDPIKADGQKAYYFEEFANYLKWLFPIILLIIALWGIRRSSLKKQ